MNSSSMMTGVLVVGSITSVTPHLGQYITESTTATKRTPKKTIPVRIAVTKHK